VQPFLEAARRIGVPVESRLQAAGLPADWVEDDACLLPEHNAWDFIHTVTRREGVENFGALSARAIPHHEFSTLAPLLADCATLFDLLNRFIAVAPWQSTVTAYRLVPKADGAWFTHTGLRLVTDDVQVSLFQLSGMLQLVRRGAGEDWCPTELHLPFPPQPWMLSDSEFGRSRLSFSMPYAAFPIPRALLSRPIVLRRPDTRAHGEEVGPVPASLTDQVLEILASYLGQEDLGVGFISGICGLSPRTLQRRLARERTTLSELVDRARFEAATRLLTESDLGLVDICVTAGYRNHSSFSRAFRRWAGVTPRDYRRMSRENGPG
jgi:AraC-like DNA-binding protein